MLTQLAAGRAFHEELALAVHDLDPRAPLIDCYSFPDVTARHLPDDIPIVAHLYFHGDAGPGELLMWQSLGQLTMEVLGSW